MIFPPGDALLGKLVVFPHCPGVEDRTLCSEVVTIEQERNAWGSEYRAARVRVERGCGLCLHVRGAQVFVSGNVTDLPLAAREFRELLVRLHGFGSAMAIDHGRVAFSEREGQESWQGDVELGHWAEHDYIDPLLPDPSDGASQFGEVGFMPTSSDQNGINVMVNEVVAVNIFPHATIAISRSWRLSQERQATRGGRL